MRRLVTDGIEVVGLVAITIGAALTAAALGWFVGGLCALLVGWRFGGRA